MFMSLLLTVAVSLGAGMLYEILGNRADQHRFPQVGRSYRVSGASLNLHCTGGGQPAVILESAIGSPGYSWFDVQIRLADLAQVCWYDRAGYGWSTRATTRRDANTIAADLHALLAAAGVSPPYMLVGQGSGTAFVDVYRSRYPGEVSAVLHIDPPQRTVPIAQNAVHRLIPVAINIGLVRAMQHLTGFSVAPVNVSAYDRELLDYLLLQTEFFRAALAEMDAFPESVSQVGHSIPPADTVTADFLREPAKVAAAIRSVWTRVRRLE